MDEKIYETFIVGLKTLSTYFSQLTINDYHYYSCDKFDFEYFTDNESIEFIRKYFDIGEKADIIEGIKYKFNDEVKFRASHSTSLYLIGIVLYQNKELKKEIDTFLKLYNCDSFLYIWFLISLYHDFTTIDEKVLKLNNFNLINKLIQRMDNRLFPEPFTKKIISSYYRYRQDDECADHGIFGGCLLNDRLRKNFKRIKKIAGVKGRKEFECYERLWSEKHYKWYDLASTVIMKHNIWFINKESDNNNQKKRIDIYNIKGLSPLIIDNNHRLSFSNNPLLFLLYIIDTIEPLKNIRCVNNQAVLPDTLNNLIINNISMSFNCINGVYIMLFQIDEKYSEIKVSKFKDKVFSLKDWLNIKVDLVDKGCFSIRWEKE